MTLPPPLAPLARLLGRDEFIARLGLVSFPLDARVREQLSQFVDERFDRLVDGLIEETAASDDVTDRASAEAFAEDRLGDLSLYLSIPQIERLRDRLHARFKTWG